MTFDKRHLSTQFLDFAADLVDATAQLVTNTLDLSTHLVNVAIEFVTYLVDATAQLVTPLVDVAIEFITHLVDATVQFGADGLDFATEPFFHPLDAAVEVFDIPMDPCGEGANLISHLAGQADLDAHQGNTYAKDGKQNTEGHDHGRRESTLSEDSHKVSAAVARRFLPRKAPVPVLQALVTLGLHTAVTGLGLTREAQPSDHGLGSRGEADACLLLQ